MSPKNPSRLDRPPARTRSPLVGGFPALLIALCLTLPAFSQETATRETPPEPFANLPAETAKKLRGAFSKWLEAVAGPRQRLVEKRLLKTVDEMTGEFRLEEGAVAILKEAAKKAVADSRAPWEEVMIDWIETIYAEQLSQNGNDPAEFVNEIVESMTNVDESDIEMMLEEAPVSEKASPRNQAAWKSGLEKALSPDQLAKVNEGLDLEKRQADKQLADLRDRMLKAVENQLHAEIRPAVELLRNTIPMDESRAKAVDDAATAAVAQTLEKRRIKVTEALDKIPPSARQQMMMNDLGENFDIGNEGEEEAAPSKQEAWTGGLAKILTREEAADWSKALAASEAEQKKKTDEQLSRLIETFSENYRQNFTRQMDPIVADIRSSVNLDAERAEKLTKASEAAISSSIEGWKKKATEEVGKMAARQREMMMQQGYVSVGWDENHQPQNQKGWKDSLASLLTADEKARWEAGIARRAEHRQRVANLILVSALDDRLAFTAGQRSRLEPILAKTAQGQLAQRLDQQWGSMNFRSLASNLRQADHEGIKKLLEDWQRELWTSQIEKADRREDQRQRADQPNQLPDDGGIPAAPDPVATESRISGFLHRMMKQEREQIEARLIASANDLARAADLSPDKARLLRIAVKGAAEDEVNDWFDRYSQWVRNQIDGGDQNPQNIDVLLRGVGRVNFGRQAAAEEAQPWKTATDHLLTESERAAWRKEVEARKAYRAKATVDLVLTQFDNSARLTGEQFESLSKLAHASLKNYAPDIDRYFGNRDPDTPWHLNSYYNMLILEGIPEKEMKEVVSESQWKTWETEFRGRTSGYWNNIKRFHEERLKKDLEEENKQNATRGSNPPAKK